MSTQFHQTSTETLSRLALTHKPVVFLNSKEEYYPCSIEYFFKHSTYYRGSTALYDEGEITPDTLPPDATHNDAMVVNAIYYSGSMMLSEVPMYARARDVKLDTGECVVQISYCFIYTYNGPKNILGCFQVGAHQGDVEHITVELRGGGYTPHRVYFGAHKSDDGLWVNCDECEYTANKQLIVYSAKDSHASYPHPQEYVRCIGFADDNTDAGEPWDGPVVVIDDTTAWNSWCGHLGSEPTPGHHGWWSYENETSTTWCKRAWCICE